jgi:predicted RecB family nuclease
MQSHNGALQLSATDLSNFLGCKHRTALDMAVTTRVRTKPTQSDDPLLQLLFDRGLDHEKQYVDWLKAQPLRVEDLSHIDSLSRPDELVAATHEAMHQGADVIVQGALRDAQWFGKPDILYRVETASDLGPWSYEVYDTKLSRKTKAGAILQLSLYTAMVAKVQGTTPQRFYVVSPRMAIGKPSPDELSKQVSGPDSMMVLEYRTSDYAAYFRLVRLRMEETVVRDALEVATANYPDPVEHCAICRWNRTCDAKRHADDHISLVAGIGRMQRRELATLGITTRRQCGETWPLPSEPRRGSLEMYENLHRQAALQLKSTAENIAYEVRPVVSYRPASETEPAQSDEGLCRLPEPSPGDMFLDFEGDPYAVEGGREYLTGIVTIGGAEPEFEALWGFTDDDERKSFERLMDMIAERRAKYPGMHVYHYAPYETTALRKLRLRYESRGDELDEFLRGGVFVDLYGVVRQGVRVGTESYSIKKLEPLYGFKRKVELEEATLCRNAIEIALQSGQMPTDDIIEKVRGYNEDDCVSTLELRDWLEKVRAEQHPPIPRPTVVEEEEAVVNEHQQAVNNLRAVLLAGVPEDPAHRSADQQALWLLAYLLDFHRREYLATVWEYWRLKELPEEDLIDEPNAIFGLEFVERVKVGVTKKGVPTGKVIDRYRYPAQEMEIEKGGLKLRQGGTLGDVDAVDRIARTIDVDKQKVHKDYHPRAVFAFTYIATKSQEQSLLAIGQRVADDGGLNVTPGGRDRAARRLLLALAPVLSTGALSGPKTDDVVKHLVNATLALDKSVLPVQGPPGAGKTFAGGESIVALVKAGKKVGVTANSHAVIRNLLCEVAAAAKRHGTSIAIAHKGDGDDDMGTAAGIQPIGSNKEARQVLDDGTAQVLGGTSWLWARDDMANSVDYLFVDEAGQLALANVIAMSPCATNIVLLGDPQQLEQPVKAAHPIGVDVSALEHALAGHITLPNDRGVFLPKTWRMCPDITEFTSEMFYEGRLSSIEGLNLQTLTGGDDLNGAGLRAVFVEHDGNRSYSNEEVDTVVAMARKLASGSVSWIDSKGKSKVLEGKDILVVGPYNSHVSRLVRGLEGTGTRAGTVDKFQGQEAPVVIFSMATSRPEDAPRGMDFLYSLNRLNVATSRARCLAVIIASGLLFEPECRTPRQMKLANALCRFRELSQQ